MWSKIYRCMKFLLIVLLLAAAAYFYFAEKKPSTSPAPIAPATPEQREPVVQREVPKPEPPAIPAPVAAPIAAAPESTPPSTRTPEGTYFVLQRISIPTDDGIVGISPGTKVTVVKAGPPLRVTNGKLEFDVMPGQVTNDLDVATRAFQSTVRQQSQVVAMNQSQTEQLRIQSAERAKENAALGEAETKRARAVLELRARLPALAAREAALQRSAAEVRAAFFSRGKQTFNGHHPSELEMSKIENEFRSAAEARANVENQIGQLQK